MVISTVARRLLLLLIVAVAALVGPAVTGHSLASATDQLQLRGVLSDPEGTPVPGVRIQVSAESGFTGSGVSGADGVWTVPVPEPATYTVLLLTDSLPEGVDLRDADRNPLTVNILSSSKTVQFPLGEDVGGGSQLAGRAIQLLVDGLASRPDPGAVGGRPVADLRDDGLTNFAHGDLMTLGAVATLRLNNRPAHPARHRGGRWRYRIRDLGSGTGRRVLWRPLRRRGTGLIAMLVVSIGLGILAALHLPVPLRRQHHQYADYTARQGPRDRVVSITPKSMIGAGVAIMAILRGHHRLAAEAQMGKASRAIADNPALASASGIDVEKRDQRVWIIGATPGGTRRVICSA